MDEELDLHHLVEVYNQNFAEILDIHAPLKSKLLTSLTSNTGLMAI